MRKVSLAILLVAAITVSGCQNKSEKTNSISTDLITNPVSANSIAVSGNLPVLEFDQVKHDFGIVVQSEKITYKFSCKNTGGSDAIISDVTSSCGCTVTSWTKAPIKPGEKGEVEVIFNSTGKPSGYMSKTVKVLANTQPNVIELEVTAEIYVPDKKR
jgi:hypothetical protein